MSVMWISQADENMEWLLLEEEQSPKITAFYCPFTGILSGSDKISFINAYITFISYIIWNDKHNWIYKQKQIWLSPKFSWFQFHVYKLGIINAVFHCSIVYCVN